MFIIHSVMETSVIKIHYYMKHQYLFVYLYHKWCPLVAGVPQMLKATIA